MRPGLKLGTWTAREDKIIVDARARGVTSFADIARLLEGRTAESVRERYVNKLDPSLVTTPWTTRERRLLSGAVLQHGHKWGLIAQQFPGRSENSCKNTHFNSLTSNLRRQVKKRKLDEEIMQPELVTERDAPVRKRRQPKQRPLSSVEIVEMLKDTEFAPSMFDDEENEEISLFASV